MRERAAIHPGGRFPTGALLVATTDVDLLAHSQINSEWAMRAGEQYSNSRAKLPALDPRAVVHLRPVIITAEVLELLPPVMHAVLESLRLIAVVSEDAEQD